MKIRKILLGALVLALLVAVGLWVQNEVQVALLSKSGEGRADAICGSFYNTGIVIGVPSRVKRFSTAARTCSSAT